MANSLVVKGFDKSNVAALRELLGSPDDNNDLTDGLRMGFPIVSIKGKVFRVKKGGEEEALLNSEGDPISSLICVILKSSPYVGKIYYAKSYADGDDDNPDCFSVDGFKPDPSVQEPQHTNCAACPMNAFGSRISENGSKVKACSDSRRLAILPYPDLSNNDEGPLMLRVPTMSMRNLAKLKSDFKQLNAPYRAAVLKIGFDPDKAYPALTFKIIQALDKSEAMEVAEWLESVELEAIFNDVVEHQPEPAAPESDQDRVDAIVKKAEEDAGGEDEDEATSVEDELAEARAQVEKQKKLAAAKKKAKAEAAAKKALEEAAAEEEAEEAEDDEEAELLKQMAAIKAKKAAAKKAAATKKAAADKKAAAKKATPKQEALDEGEQTSDEDETDLDTLLADALGD